MKITYTKKGDYLIPDLTVPSTNVKQPLGKYAQLRLNYIKEHNKTLYTTLLFKNKLTEHLKAIDQTATSRIEYHIKLLAEKNNVNEKLKNTDQMKWIGLMNSFKNSAEEIVLKELIYG